MCVCVCINASLPITQIQHNTHTYTYSYTTVFIVCQHRFNAKIKNMFLSVCWYLFNNASTIYILHSTHIQASFRIVTDFILRYFLNCINYTSLYLHNMCEFFVCMDADTHIIYFRQTFRSLRPLCTVIYIHFQQIFIIFTLFLECACDCFRH